MRERALISTSTLPSTSRSARNRSTFGRPYRIDALDDALAYICRHDDVWLATGSEIADAFVNSGVAF